MERSARFFPFLLFWFLRNPKIAVLPPMEWDTVQRREDTSQHLTFTMILREMI